MIKTEYDSHSNPNTTKAIYEAICKEMWHCNKRSIWKNKQCPTGYIIGRNGQFVAYVHMYKHRHYMDIEFKLYTFRFASKTLETDIINNITELEQGSMAYLQCDQRMTLLCKGNVHHDDGWVPTEVIPYRSLDNVPQKSIDACSTILHIMAEQEHIGGVFLLCGPPGTGKTMTTKLLAVKLNASICLDFDPSKPANLLTRVITSHPPTHSQPLIIVIEEVDKVFDRFGNVKDHDEYRTQVKDKNDWNNMLDYVGMLENVIVILTSNFTIQKLRSRYDHSLTRSFRVNKCIEF